MPTEPRPELPKVYTIRGCAACVKLLQKLDADGVAYEERRVELNQNTLNEARKLGQLVPIIVWPDGKVEQGFGDTIGCFI
jgi:glutaredoxin